MILSASGILKILLKQQSGLKEKKGKVISILGFDGGLIKKLSNVCIHIKSEKGDYGPVEDIQLIINHILAHWFQIKLKTKVK